MPSTGSPLAALRSPGLLRPAVLLALVVAACAVGPQTVNSGDGATIMVPAGAWDGSEPLQVVVDEAPLPLPDDFAAVSDVYALLPHGATFDVAVTVSLPYQAAFGADLYVLRLGDDMDEIWEPVVGPGFDGNTASFETLQFSWYVVAESTDGGDDDDDDDSAVGPLEYEGDLTITSDDEMATFCATYDRVAGNVDVSGALVTDGTLLDCLVEVSGDFAVHDTLVSELQLPALQSVGGSLEFASNGSVLDVAAPVLTTAGSVGVSSSEALASLDLSTLAQVDGAFEVSGSQALTGLDLGALETVGGDLDVFASSALETLSLGNLLSVGGLLRVADCPQVSGLSLDVLQQVGSAILSGQQIETLDLSTLQEATTGGLSLWGMDRVDLSSLTTVAGTLSFSTTGAEPIQLPLVTSAGSLDVSWSAQILSIQAPLLTALTADLTIVNNGLLVTLSLPSLGSMGGDFMIQSNASLPTSSAEALRDQIGVANIGGTVSIVDNGSG